MTAKIKSIADDDRNIPLAGGLVEAGATFEISDEDFWHHDWSTDLYDVVEPSPASTKPKSSDDPPAKNASKGDWLEYAKSRGADPEVINDLTRDQLAEQFGDQTQEN
jgi:hypothetical protein